MTRPMQSAFNVPSHFSSASLRSWLSLCYCCPAAAAKLSRILYLSSFDQLRLSGKKADTQNEQGGFRQPAASWQSCPDSIRPEETAKLGPCKVLCP